MRMSAAPIATLFATLSFVLLSSFAIADEDLAELSEATKQRLQQLVADSAFVAEVELEKGEFTGAMMLHKTKVRARLKDRLDAKALFAHLDAKDGKLPAAIQPPKNPMPKLAAGDYVVVVYAVEVINSFPGVKVPLFGRIMKPKRSYNYFIQRNGSTHCAWPTSSPEAQYLRSLTATK